MNGEKGESYYKKQKGKKEDKKLKKHMRRCPYCGNIMVCRGASDSMGSISWKCKGRKCGRTIWERREVRPPIPVVYEKHNDKRM